MHVKSEIELSIEVGIDLFKDLIFTAWKAATDYTKKEFPDPFGIATKKYIGGLIERYNLVKVLGMREPMPLKSLYVRANILEKLLHEMFLPKEDLEGGGAAK